MTLCLREANKMTQQSDLQLTAESLAEILRTDASKVAVIDVRDQDEYETGHIDGSKNVPLTELAPLFDHPDDSVDMIFVCESGLRSLQAANFARIAGLTRIRSLDGGMSAWKLLTKTH